MLLHEKFIYTARQFPDKIAFIDRYSDRKVTYAKSVIASLVLSKKNKKSPRKTYWNYDSHFCRMCFFNNRNINGWKSSCDD